MNMNQYIDKIFTTINQYLYSIHFLENNTTEELNAFMRTIKQLSDNETFINCFNKKYSSEQKQKLGKLLLKIECIVEKKSVLDYLNGETDLINEKLNRCKPCMVKEGQALKITEQSHVLLIGSGAMPISGVILYKEFGCKITCLDIDRDALQLSQKWIEKLGIRKNFSFLCNNIFNIDNLTEYTHLLVTGHISDKTTLLKQLHPYMKSQKLLLRNSTGVYRGIYGYTSDFTGYKILDIINHAGNMPYHSILIKSTYVSTRINTPCYTFELETIQANYKYLCNHLKVCDRVFYALKANGEPTIIKMLGNNNVPFEVCSCGEMNIVKENVEKPIEIICSLPVKTKTLIKYLYNEGCRYFVFDCWEEYQKLEELAPEALRIVRLNIKDISSSTIDYGMYEEDFYSEYNKTGKKVDGVTFYNIPNLSKTQISLILDRCMELLESLSQRPRILNIGGNYRFQDDLEDGFYEVLNQKLYLFKERMPDLMIYAEPGRTIVKSAGSIMTRVVSIQKRHDIYEIFIDAGIPSGILYSPKKVSVLGSLTEPIPQNINYRFYGVTCSKKLLFETELNLLLEEDDVLILEEMGTYSLCKSNHFHGWETPKTIYFS